MRSTGSSGGSHFLRRITAVIGDKRPGYGRSTATITPVSGTLSQPLFGAIGWTSALTAPPRWCRHLSPVAKCHTHYHSAVFPLSSGKPAAAATGCRNARFVFRNSRRSSCPHPRRFVADDVVAAAIASPSLSLSSSRQSRRR